MNRSARIATHLTAAALGIAIAAFSGGRHSTHAPAGAATGNSSPSRSSGTGIETATTSSTQNRQTSLSIKSSDFKTAWDSIPARRLLKNDRLRMQKQLLEKWARVDLRAALDAMNTMAWQEDEYYSTTDAPWTAFSQVFSERPDEAWELLQSGRYGLAAGRLRWEWMKSVSKSDGALVISKLNDMPPGLRSFAIFRSIENQKTGAEIEAMAAKVIALAGDGNQEWLQAVASITGNPASDPFTDPPDDLAAQREGWMKLPEGPARQMALLHWGKDLGKQNPATITGELAAIPPEAREAAAGAMMSQVFDPLPVVILKLDFAMKTASWDTLTQSKLETIVNRFADIGDTDPKETAAWALTLPQRKGTPEIYQAAVTAYISEDTPGALEWLEGLEEGSWQKDNALAVYSRQMLEKHEDSEASQWAFDAITDPNIRAQVHNWKNDRELRLKDHPYKDKW